MVLVTNVAQNRCTRFCLDLFFVIVRLAFYFSNLISFSFFEFGIPVDTVVCFHAHDLTWGWFTDIADDRCTPMHICSVVVLPPVEVSENLNETAPR